MNDERPTTKYEHKISVRPSSTTLHLNHQSNGHTRININAISLQHQVQARPAENDPSDMSHLSGAAPEKDSLAVP